MSEEHRFNPNEHLMQIKNRNGTTDYLPVQWRLVWFREQCPQGTIDTQEVIVDLDREVEEEVYVWNNEKRRSEKVIKHARGYARFKTIATDGKGGRATGTKSENAASFPDFVEKAETGSIGRALAALGYGTQFTGDEFDEAHRIVDAPVDRTQATANGSNYANSSNGSTSNNGAPRDENAESTATEQQVASIRKLCQHLGKSEPDNVTSISFLAAKQLIQQLTAEYKLLSKPTSEPANSNPPASPGLVAAAQRLYTQAGQKPPADLAQKSTEEVKRLMQEVNAHQRDQINTKNGHGPTAQNSSPATQPMSIVHPPDVKTLRAQCARLQKNWDVIVKTALKANVPDDNITPEQQVRIKEFLDIVEEQQARNTPAERAS